MASTTTSKAVLTSLTLTSLPDFKLAIEVSFAFGATGQIAYTQNPATSAWLSRLMRTIGAGSITSVIGLTPIGHTCRLRLANGAFGSVGHPVDENWFHIGDGDGAGSGIRSTGCDRATRALAHINKHRARRGLRDLDPVASCWTTDDVITEALRLRWDG